MPKKYPDETIYMKVDGKYKAIGKIYDRDHVGYGNYFIYNNKYSRGIRWIGASPNPDFIGLETAVELCKDTLEKELRDIIDDFVSGKINNSSYRFYLTDSICQAIRKTFLDKKKEMLEKIKN
jgi:hypothetical protein